MVKNQTKVVFFNYARAESFQIPMENELIKGLSVFICCHINTFWFCHLYNVLG